MSAISGTRRAMREMADGTIRVQIDVDPACRAAFLDLFPSIDMPIALAPLKPAFEKSAPAKLKGGPLSVFAARLCSDPDFWNFAGEAEGEQEAAEWVRNVCGVESRAELDHDERAAADFHRLIRRPWAEMHGVAP